MCNQELLVAYLYEDLSDADRARCDRHLGQCAVCRRELEALRAVRVDLATWSPPLPDFGFRIVQNHGPNHAAAAPAPALSSPRWKSRWLPAFGFAAAAVLVLAAAAAMAHVEVRRDQNGFSVRTGWGTSAPAAVTQSALAQPAPPVHPASATASPDAAAIKEIELRLAALETSSHDAGVRQASAIVRTSDAELLRKVKDLVAQSEVKERGELALRMSQVIHDVDAQRVADLSRIQQGLDRVDALTAREEQRHVGLARYITGQGTQK